MVNSPGLTLKAVTLGAPNHSHLAILPDYPDDLSTPGLRKTAKTRVEIINHISTFLVILDPLLLAAANNVLFQLPPACYNPWPRTMIA
jgi:hypothetical protein